MNTLWNKHIITISGKGLTVYESLILPIELEKKGFNILNIVKRKGG